MMSDNFANFYGAPPNAWYMMGVAAGLMTKSNKLGFVAAFPLGWTLTFINAFELGAQSVNPKAETTVAYTFNWGDAAKEADATNSLINQGADVITMHVDSPSTVISTAELRGVLLDRLPVPGRPAVCARVLDDRARGLHPGRHGHLADLDGDRQDLEADLPALRRQGRLHGHGAVRPHGLAGDQGRRRAGASVFEAGTKVVFAGPIVDQDGTVQVAEGEVLSADVMGSVDWLVNGVVGSPK